MAHDEVTITTGFAHFIVYRMALSFLGSMQYALHLGPAGCLRNSHHCAHTLVFIGFYKPVRCESN